MIPLLLSPNQKWVIKFYTYSKTIKPASRKSGPTFEPREVIEYLAGQYRNGESEETQLMAVKMYFKLKKLMYDFDEICDSSDEDSKPKGSWINSENS